MERNIINSTHLDYVTGIMEIEIVIEKEWKLEKRTLVVSYDGEINNNGEVT